MRGVEWYLLDLLITFNLANMHARKGLFFFVVCTNLDFPIELTVRVVEILNETTVIETNRTVVLGNKICMSW